MCKEKNPIVFYYLHGGKPHKVTFLLCNNHNKSH